MMISLLHDVEESAGMNLNCNARNWNFIVAVSKFAVGTTTATIMLEMLFET